MLGETELAARSFFSRTERFSKKERVDLMNRATSTNLLGKLVIACDEIKEWNLTESALYRFMLLNFWSGQSVSGLDKDKIDRLEEKTTVMGQLVKFWALVNQKKDQIDQTMVFEKLADLTLKIDNFLIEMSEKNKEVSFEMGIVASSLIHLFKFKDSPLRAKMFELSEDLKDRCSSLRSVQFEGLLKNILKKIKKVLKKPFNTEQDYQFFRGFLSVFGCRLIENVGGIFDLLTTRRMIVHRGAKIISELIKLKGIRESFIFDSGNEYILTSVNLVVLMLLDHIDNRGPDYISDLDITEQFRFANLRDGSQRITIEDDDDEEDDEDEEYDFGLIKSGGCYLPASDDVKIELKRVADLDAKIMRLEEDYDVVEDDMLDELDMQIRKLENEKVKRCKVLKVRLFELTLVLFEGILI